MFTQTALKLLFQETKPEPQTKTADKLMGDILRTPQILTIPSNRNFLTSQLNIQFQALILRSAIEHEQRKIKQ